MQCIYLNIGLEFHPLNHHIKNAGGIALQLPTNFNIFCKQTRCSCVCRSKVNKGKCIAAAVSVHCSVYVLFHCRYAYSYRRLIDMRSCYSILYK